MAASLVLGGCDSFNRAIGKTRVIPDEFAVVSNTPLAIPPDYNLRPPRIGGGNDRAQSPTDQARETVFRAGDNQQAALPAPDAPRSPGEDDLLQKTGADTAPPDIRTQIDSDPQQGIPFERSLVDRLVNWNPAKTPPSNDVINPTDEASRLRLEQSVANTAGAAPTPTTDAGAGTPTFERTTKGTGWFGWLF
jgi:hypothetical protein